MQPDDIESAWQQRYDTCLRMPVYACVWLDQSLRICGSRLLDTLPAGRRKGCRKGLVKKLKARHQLSLMQCPSARTLNIKLSHRKKHGLDMTSEPARQLELMHLIGGDFALEQPRPLPPKVKLVGALMPRPAKPLPPELEVCLAAVPRKTACPAHPCCQILGCRPR